MREIDEITVHCTATPEGQTVTVAQIDAWHKARKWSGCGYHRIIGILGERWSGRPIERIGAHVAGRNKRTIGLVYVGGVERDGKTPKDTRTDAQKESLLIELEDLRDRFNIQKVSGHNEYAAKACPSFDASAEYDHLFPEGGNIVTEADGILERGDVGQAVSDWAAQLAEYRRKTDHPYPVPATDMFDHTLELVTIWFQNERGIVADGKVGPQTEDEMERALAGFRPYEAIRSKDTGPDIDLARKHLFAAQSALGSA